MINTTGARTAFALVALFASSSALAGFDWGSDCQGGAGDFTQFLYQDEVELVGFIPAGKEDVTIFLDSIEDVDIQLVDDLTGTEIISWPSGLLSGPTSECVDYAGRTYCYSGYNGDQTWDGAGFEWISIDGETNRPLTMYAYGYETGTALVDYSWDASTTCNEIGDGAFSQYIPYDDTILVGDIPAGKSNVVIDLGARFGNDVDVQLWDGNVPLIAWPNGLLSSAGPAEIEYNGARIVYSGYNGINGDYGHETIEIYGEVPFDLSMYAFGYQSGTADIDYAWGVGVGEACNSDANCEDGLWCQYGDGFEGVCHTPTWCESDDSADDDCSDLETGAFFFGDWTCEDYGCVFQQGW